MAFNRICPGHCKLRKTHKWWHASDFFLHFRTGCFGVLRLSNDINSCWHDFYSIYRFVPRKLRGFVPWFYHWRHQLRTKQRDYINTYYHTSHTQKKICSKKNMLNKSICCFLSNKKTKIRHFHRVTAAPGFCPTPWNGPTQQDDPPVKASWRKGAMMGAQGDGVCCLVQDEVAHILQAFLQPFTLVYLATKKKSGKKMGGKTDGIFLWYIWYVLNLKQKVMVVIQADTLTGWHGPRVYIILYGGKVWQSMVEVPKFGRLQKSKQRLVVDAKGIYILHYSMMMMLQMPELPFTSAQFVPTSQSHMNFVRAHTSSPIPRRAKIRPGVPTWARWPIIDLCMAIAMIQY